MAGESLIFTTKPHNHSLDPIAVKVNMAMSELIAKVKNDPKIPTSSIIAEWSKAHHWPSHEKQVYFEKDFAEKGAEEEDQD